MNCLILDRLSEYFLRFNHKCHFHKNHIDIDLFVEVEFRLQMVVGLCLVILVLIYPIQLL